MKIRTYEPHDWDRLDYICLKTGDSGTDATGKWADDQLLSYIYVLPYAKHAPNWVWVADEGGEAYGYLASTKNVAAFRLWWDAHWVPVLEKKFPAEARAKWPPNEEAFFERWISPTRPQPKWLHQFPAELHINLLPKSQGQGAGRRLMEALTQKMRDNGIPGVQLAVAGSNLNAIGFYEHLGFKTLSSTFKGGMLTGKTMGLSVEPRTLQGHSL